MVAPALKEKEKGKGEMIAIGLLIFVVLLAGIALGFTLETKVISPPAQVFGTCPPPAYVSGGACLVKQVQIINSQTQTVTQTAGSIIIPGAGP